jgi:DeoR/GlpR family transcriptional regulator of sugar metabolism
MDAAQRHQLVGRWLEERGEVTVAGLADATGVSEMTMRRDLEHLERSGLLRRVHGGAVAVSRSFELPFAARLAVADEAKQKIGAAVAAMLEPGETVLLDGGTTAYAVGAALPESACLTVCVLNLHVAEAIQDRPGLRLLVPGGEARPGERSLTGQLTLAALAGLNFDTYVLTIGGIDAAAATEFNLDDTAVKQAGLRSARRTLVAASGEKVGRRAFATITTDLAGLTLVTDGSADTTVLDALRERGMTVVTV